MADGAYERRGPREAELKRLDRIISEVRRRLAPDPESGKKQPSVQGNVPAGR